MIKLVPKPANQPNNNKKNQPHKYGNTTATHVFFCVEVKFITLENGTQKEKCGRELPIS